MSNVFYYQSTDFDVEQLIRSLHSSDLSSPNYPSISSDTPKSTAKKRPFSAFKVATEESRICTANVPSLDIVNTDFIVTLGEVLTPLHFYLVKKFDEDYDDLQEQMNIFYQNTSNSPVTSVDIGSHFVTKMASTNSFARIKVIKKLNQSICHCFFIDEGFASTVLIKKMYPLDKQFCRLAPRSFNAGLSSMYLSQC